MSNELKACEDCAERIVNKFILEFCNDHNGEIRFLRSIFYDEKDGAETIIKFIRENLKIEIANLAKRTANLSWKLECADKENEKLREELENWKVSFAGADEERYKIRKELAEKENQIKDYLKICQDKDKNLARLKDVDVERPRIVCLCGSTRFMQEFFDAGWIFTLKGYIVLSVGVCKHAEHHGGEALGQEVADKLDVLHLRKIDLADEVFVLNVGGYIGKSTAKEIAYAKSKDKPILYLESLDKGVKKGV